MAVAIAMPISVGRVLIADLGVEVALTGRLWRLIHSLSVSAVSGACAKVGGVLRAITTGLGRVSSERAIDEAVDLGR